MKKLTNKTKYRIVNGEAVIYAKRIGSNKFEPAFTCNTACIDRIKQANSFKVEGVHIVPINWTLWIINLYNLLTRLVEVYYTSYTGNKKYFLLDISIL